MPQYIFINKVNLLTFLFFELLWISSTFWRTNIQTTWHLIKYPSELDLSTLQAQVWRAYFTALTRIVKYRLEHNCRDVLFPEEWPLLRRLSIMNKRQKSYMWSCSLLLMNKLNQNVTKTRKPARRSPEKSICNLWEIRLISMSCWVSISLSSMIFE